MKYQRKREDNCESVRAGVMAIYTSINGKSTFIGSGYLITQDGFVLTNAHVVIDDETSEAYQKIWVKFVHHDPFVSATVRKVGWNTPFEYDLALLKLEYVPPPAIALTFGNFPDISRHEKVYIVGYPFGTAYITDGCIGALDQSGEHLFMHNCVVHSGSSGSPILNETGVVVGTHKGMLPNAPGMNYAIPAMHARLFINRCIEEGEEINLSDNSQQISTPGSRDDMDEPKKRPAKRKQGKAKINIREILPYTLIVLISLSIFLHSYIYYYEPILSDGEVEVLIPYDSVAPLSHPKYVLFSDIEFFDPYNAYKKALRLKAMALEEGSTMYDAIQRSLPEQIEHFTIFDITLYYNGAETIDPVFKKDVIVTISIPDDYQPECIAILHILEDGTYKEIPCTISRHDRTVTFYTSEFSCYVVTEKNEPVHFD